MNRHDDNDQKKQFQILYQIQRGLMPLKVFFISRTIDGTAMHLEIKPEY